MNSYEWFLCESSRQLSQMVFYGTMTIQSISPSHHEHSIPLGMQDAPCKLCSPRFAVWFCEPRTEVAQQPRPCGVAPQPCVWRRPSSHASLASRRRRDRTRSPGNKGWRWVALHTQQHEGGEGRNDLVKACHTADGEKIDSPQFAHAQPDIFPSDRFVASFVLLRCCNISMRAKLVFSAAHDVNGVCWRHVGQLRARNKCEHCTADMRS